MRKTARHTALWTALVVSVGISMSACSGDSHEVVATERVDEAARIAIANAPEPEDFEFAETAPMAVTPAVADVDADAEATDMVAADTTAEASADLAVDVGANLYNTQCMACHASGLLNAPKYGDAAAWAPRIAKGIDTLTDHSANGFNQMPAQAVNGVTEDQIRSAVEYMVDAAS